MEGPGREGGSYLPNARNLNALDRSGNIDALHDPVLPALCLYVVNDIWKKTRVSLTFIGQLQTRPNSRVIVQSESE